MTLSLRLAAFTLPFVPLAASAQDLAVDRAVLALPDADPTRPSAAATRVADWIAATKDNHALPYAIVDKANASLLLFDAKGRSLAQVPVLIGIAPG